MSSNVRQTEANVVEVAFSTASSIAAGRGVLVGNLFGVAELDIASTSAAPAAGAGAQLRVRGVVEIAKTGSLAVSVGDALYWDDTGKVVNKTDSTKQIGIALTSTSDGSGETTVNMMLVQSVRNGTAS